MVPSRDVRLHRAQSLLITTSTAMTLPSCMRAVAHARYGGPDALQLVERPVPLPGPGEVLLRVHAASVNPADWRRLRADPAFIRIGTGLRRPRRQVLGADVSGQVVAVGAGVDETAPGDPVFGDIEYGGFAEYACARADRLVPIPPHVPFEAAAAVPLAGTTALQALRLFGGVRPGQRVLVNGASGGVGTLAVQLAVAGGAEVTAVCGGRNAAMVRGLGAARVVDYTRERPLPAGETFDLVLDLVGTLSIAELLHAVRPNGAAVVVGFASTGRLIRTALQAAWHRRMSGRNVTFLSARPDRSDLLHLAARMERGELVPFIDRRYPLSEVPEAVRYVMAGRASGKVVVSIDEETVPAVTAPRERSSFLLIAPSPSS